MARLSVLFCTEGTYPFVGGGVSTWCDILCRELGEVDFVVWAVTGTPEVSCRYQLPPNVRDVVHIPLWGTQEPAEIIRARVPFSDVYRSKGATTAAVIESEFVPLLRRFLQGMQGHGHDIADYGPVVHQLWRYFRRYDWNTTWKSEAAWQTFLGEVLPPYRDEASGYLPHEVPSVFDLTTSMRWMYNFLAPLAAPIPETDLVHTTIAGFPGLAGVVARHEHGTPFVVTEHGVYVRERYLAVSTGPFTAFAKRFLVGLASFVARLNYAFADVVAPVADFNRRWEVPYGADPLKMRTIYNGVDPTCSSRGPSRSGPRALRWPWPRPGSSPSRTSRR